VHADIIQENNLTHTK